MTANRTFGLAMLILGGLLLWYVSTGLLTPAPLLVAFAAAGSIGAVGLGLWGLFGKF